MLNVDMKNAPNHNQDDKFAVIVDTNLLALAAKGDEEAEHEAIGRMCKSTPEEIRILRRAIFRLEGWLDEVPLCR